MYYDYFGLKQPPFKITPDTSLFFSGGNRGAILDALIYAILNGEGIIKVVGEVGSGKTMLCRMLEEELPDEVEIVYIANPSLTPENILHAIAFDLNIDVQASTTRLEVMNKLQKYLLQRYSSGQRVVVFIEEAQSMPVATLEEIRLLSNLETQQNKLLQIVLFGQPEIDEIISKREIRQLKERITYSFQLNPFGPDDIRDYINSRLRTCGYRSQEIFDPKAIKLIERYSKGLVRRVNILADKSLLAAYATNTNTVFSRHVKQAARDSEFIIRRGLKIWHPVGVFMLTLITGLLIVWQISSLLKSAPDEGRTMNQVTNTTTHNGLIIKPTLSSVNETGLAGRETTVNTTLVSINKQKKPEKSTDSGILNNDIPVSSDASVPETQDPVSRLNLNPPDVQNKHPETSYNSEVSLDKSSSNELNMLPGQPLEMIASASDHLMGLDAIFSTEEMGNELYTDEELQIMREQLEKLPPEVSYQNKPSLQNDVCKLCWSIIYRPLVEPDNM